MTNINIINVQYAGTMFNVLIAIMLMNHGVDNNKRSPIVRPGFNHN